MRFLYIFEPAEGWEYCGGALGIIAESFEEAKDFYNQAHKKDKYGHYGLFRRQAEVPRKSYGDGVGGNKPSGLAGQGWVLRHTLTLDSTSTEPSGVLFFNYNYA